MTSTLAAIVDHLVPTDDKGKRRTSRPAKWYLTLGLLAYSVYAAKDDALSAYRWYLDVNTHMTVHAPEAVQRFEALERQVKDVAKDTARVASDQSEMKTDIREIRTALLGVRPVRTTDDDADARAQAESASPFRGCPGCAAADDGVLRPGLPRRVPAAMPAGDRVGKLTEAR